MSETTEPSDIVERLAVVAQKLREHEEPLRIAGDPSGLGIGAAAILVEMAGQEITRLRAALAEQKERCARVAESIKRVPVDYPVTGLVDPHEPTRRGIAAAIRAME